LEDCRQLAADRGWVVGREYVDNDISAFSGKRRPNYERMRTDLAAGERDAVIVYNLDRLHRRPVELEDFVTLCERVGVRNVATVTADIDLGNDDGLFMARIFAAFAAKESGRKSARMKRKYDQKAEQGLPHGPARAFGYEADKITIRESEAAIVRQLVDRVIAGESIHALTIWLSQSGVSTVRGAQWQTTAVRGIVSSPRIAGLRVHRTQIVGPGVWDPIITPTQREEVLAALASRAWKRKRSPRTYLLSGMLRCGRCDTRLFSAARHQPAGVRRRYVCSSGPDHGGCGRLTVVAEPVEDVIVDAVLSRLDSPMLAHYMAGRTQSDAALAALSETLAADQRQLEELAGLYAAGAVTAREWIAARDPIQHRIQLTEKELAAATGTSAVAGLAGQGSVLRGQWPDLTLDRRHAIVKAVLDHAVIAPGVPAARRLDINRVQPVWRI
jgi:site-specific DNA recombinase